MQEFLNPKAMLTPGIAGTFMMFLANGLIVPFPEMSPRFIALGMSFLIGGVVFYSQRLQRAPVYQKAMYWVLNSLVIFVVGFGTAHIAADATDTAKSAPGAFFPFVSSAYAQDGAKAEVTKKAATQAQRDTALLKQQLEKSQIENGKLKAQLLRKEGATATPPPKEKGFFQRW